MYECGSCGAFSQIQGDLLTQSKQTLSCPECKKNNVFGHWLKNDLIEPTIEKLGVDLNNDNIPLAEPSEPAPIQWQCGICQNDFGLMTSQLSTHGSKITCTRCFNFILLRPIGFMKDLASIEVLPLEIFDSTPFTKAEDEPSLNITTNDILFDKTTTIQTHEIVEIFEEPKKNQKATDPFSSQDTVIRSGYADPRKPKAPISEIDLEKDLEDVSIPAQEPSIPSIDEIVLSSHEGEKINADPPSDLLKDSAKAPLIKSNEIPIEIPHSKNQEESTTSKELLVKKSIVSFTKDSSEVSTPPKTKPPVITKDVEVIKSAYDKVENSFMAYQEFKNNDTFTFSIKEEDLKDIDPEADTPPIIKKIEKNMTKFSLIASAFLVFVFIVVYFIQGYRNEKRIERERVEKLEMIKQQEEERAKNPAKYGFPEFDTDD